MTEKENFFNTDQLLDELLKTKPGFNLSDDFADRVALRAGNSFAWQQYWKEFLVYLAALLGIAGVVVGISFMSFGLKWSDAVSLLVSNISLVAGISFFSVFVLFADRVLLRYFMFRSSKEIL